VEIYNEPIVEVIAGVLLSLSAGVRMTLPLLVVNLLAFGGEIVLPHDMAWLGSGPTLVVLGVAAVAEITVHYIPAVGTTLKAAATPLAFVAGTLLMAVPLGNQSPLVQWTLAAFVGGGSATLMHLGVTGARAATEPLNVGTAGIFGFFWNAGEFLVSALLLVLTWLCLVVGVAMALLGLALLVAAVVVVVAKVLGWWMKTKTSTKIRIVAN